MEFNNHKPIYLQIAESLCERILSGEWQEEMRIPSVREFGVEFEVNPNTVMRTYDFLQNLDIIYNKRGIGYFVCPNAKQSIKSSLKKQFIDEDLNEVFKKMLLLDVSISEFTNLYNHFSTNK
jgi:GntR family transcriptional regulator